MSIYHCGQDTSSLISIMWIHTYLQSSSKQILYILPVPTQMKPKNSIYFQDVEKAFFTSQICLRFADENTLFSVIMPRVMNHMKPHSVERWSKVYLTVSCKGKHCFQTLYWQTQGCLHCVYFYSYLGEGGIVFLFCFPLTINDTHSLGSYSPELTFNWNHPLALWVLLVLCVFMWYRIKQFINSVLLLLIMPLPFETVPVECCISN